MFSLFAVKNLSPAQVKAGLDAGEIVLVDVRESDEHNAERIRGSGNVPLSRLKVAKLPQADGIAAWKATGLPTTR